MPSSFFSPRPIPEQERASTGIDGLDAVLGGGLPTHHLYLIEGNPGAGKTTMGLQFLRRGMELGEKGLYITLSETTSELLTVAQSHGWDLDGVEIFQLVTDEGLSLDSQQSVLHPSEVELGETTRGIMAATERVQPLRVVFDSLSEMRLLAQNPLRYRRQVLALKSYFATRQCTVLLLDDRSASQEDLQLHSIAHGVICLEQSVDQYGPERRRLRVIKMRGIPFRGGEHDFNLNTGGIAVFPRLVAAEHRGHFQPETVSSGTPGLDRLLGGGLVRGSNLLFSGPSGVGKTTTAIACVRAALMRGERVAYYLFDEGLNTLLVRSRALALDVEPFIEDGRLDLRTLDPAEVSPGEFANMVRTAVEHEARIVVIDSLNAYLQAMPGDKHLMLQMHELLTFLNQRGVVTLLILSQHGVLGDLRGDVDLSYLSDGILMFRFFEARGSLLKAVSVVKSRTSAHELTIREFRLGASGIEVGEALTDFEGVMTGVPSYRGKLALLSDGDLDDPGVEPRVAEVDPALERARGRKGQG
ncbi:MULTISPECIES: ATPase domain-containing protein [Ramlibacter]|uniref:non-specific serine/threonine protein kinase n=1 Tax=Ramlibacter aquaticus TaxID=2780094 RepID=A0ABR9SHU7_9BURK|nr:MULTISPECIES: ATPase domain-containing protein [Ramlibacter]MBE7941931.1 AAA family ATPase [Ramlibacter aquaticus]